MNAVQAHRGPDDLGTHFENIFGEFAVGLAHRRLSILDISSAGHQPMWNANRTLAIIYNGELYNFADLRAELKSKGWKFKSESDTEVLLALYEHSGPAMLSRLDGIFAFAIWEPQQQALFLARDRMGVKPLYWSESRQGFLFASELKAISLWENLDRTLDSQALRHYLTYLYCPAPRTLFQSVHKLEPGYAMIVRDGKPCRHWRYASVPFDQPIEDRHDLAAITEVRESLKRAVERQMVSDVPVGAFLSGGLDSSSICAFARQKTSAPLQCFTIELEPALQKEEGQADDYPYACAMARHLDVDLHAISVRSDCIQLFDKMVFHLDEPQGDPAALNVYLISQLAREHGIKVLLSGAGGDDVFTGYRRHAALALEGYWSWLPRPVCRAMAAASGRLPAGWPPARRLRKALSAAGEDQDLRLIRYFAWLDPLTVTALTGGSVKDGDDPLIAALQELPKDMPAINKMLYLEQRFFLADHNLNYTDKMGMAAGVEIRVPFLDPDLMSLAARLPVKQKQRGTCGKWVLKEAMRGILPNELIDRPKTGFGAPVRHWLRNDLREMLNEVVGPQSKLSNCLELSSVKDLIVDDRDGRIDAAYPLLGVLAIESWIRQFVPSRAMAAA